MSVNYWFNPDYSCVEFASFDAAQQVRGELVTRSPHSEVYVYEQSKQSYYIKHYTSAGKKLRRFIGRSRNRAESENLLYFQSLSINIPTIVAYGEKRRFGLFHSGVMITEGLANTCDLAALAEQQPECFKNPRWFNTVSQTTADYTRRLHDTGFIHNDLKWRNILVDKDTSNAEVYFIDCPVGRKRFGLLRSRGIIKDLACLDKVAKKVLSKSQRLRFYMHYAKCTKLTLADKQKLRKILCFFAGRD